VKNRNEAKALFDEEFDAMMREYEMAGEWMGEQIAAKKQQPPLPLFPAAGVEENGQES
jgi:hypothetical protein